MAIAAKTAVSFVTAGRLARHSFMLLECISAYGLTDTVKYKLTSYDVAVAGFTTFSTSSVLHLGVPQPQHHSDIKTSRWNRAIAEADKLLGYPKMMTPTSMLSNIDVMSMASQMGAIVESSHPLMKIIERLVYGHNNMQAKGLIVLLLAKVIENLDNPTTATKEEIYKKHCCLATGTDLGHMSTQAHSAVSNVESVDCDNAIRSRLNYANKVSIMIGDMMLAKANLLFGSMKSIEVAQIMSCSVADFVNGMFMFDQDDQGNAYPTKSITMADWEIKSFLVNASMMANSCKSLMLLSELDNDYRNKGFEFGKCLGLAWQASAELEQFTEFAENSYDSAPFSLVSCPVVLHIQKNASLLDLLAPHRKDLSKVDYKKIHEMVSEGPAVGEAREICQNHVQNALNVLYQFPNSSARATLENIVVSLEV